MISSRILYIHGFLLILIQIMAVPSVMTRVVSLGIGLSIIVNTYMSYREKKITSIKDESVTSIKDESISVYANSEEIQSSESRTSTIERHSLTTFQ